MEATLDIPTAIGRYAIPLRSLPDTQDAETVQVAFQELDVLADFAASDEICQSLSIKLSDDGQNLEIVFYSTKRAANAFMQRLSALNIIGSKEQDAGCVRFGS
jgi:hypothetical protein